MAYSLYWSNTTFLSLPICARLRNSNQWHAILRTIPFSQSLHPSAYACILHVGAPFRDNVFVSIFNSEWARLTYLWLYTSEWETVFPFLVSQIPIHAFRGVVFCLHYCNNRFSKQERSKLSYQAFQHSASDPNAACVTADGNISCKHNFFIAFMDKSGIALRAGLLVLHTGWCNCGASHTTHKTLNHHNLEPIQINDPCLRIENQVSLHKKWA